MKISILFTILLVICFSIKANATREFSDCKTYENNSDYCIAWSVQTVYEVSEVDNKTTTLTTNFDDKIKKINTSISDFKTDYKIDLSKKASLEDLDTFKKNQAEFSKQLKAYEDIISNNKCGRCLKLDESDLGAIRSKLKCFTEEIKLYRSDEKQWTESCTAQTISYAKKLFLMLKARNERLSTGEEKFSDLLDDVYPYYNVITKE